MELCWWTSRFNLIWKSTCKDHKRKKYFFLFPFSTSFTPFCHLWRHSSLKAQSNLEALSRAAWRAYKPCLKGITSDPDFMASERDVTHNTSWRRSRYVRVDNSQVGTFALICCSSLKVWQTDRSIGNKGPPDHRWSVWQVRFCVTLLVFVWRHRSVPVRLDRPLGSGGGTWNTFSRDWSANISKKKNVAVT